MLTLTNRESSDEQVEIPTQNTDEKKEHLTTLVKINDPTNSDI